MTGNGAQIFGRLVRTRIAALGDFRDILELFDNDFVRIGKWSSIFIQEVAI